jgi:hypothetical protein
VAGLSRSQQLNAGILPSVQVCLLTYQRVPPPHKGKPQILIGPDNEYEFAWQSYEVDLGEGGGAVAFKKIAYTNKHASAVGVLWRVSRVCLACVSRVACRQSHAACPSCLLSCVSVSAVCLCVDESPSAQVCVAQKSTGTERATGNSGPERVRRANVCVHTLEHFTHHGLKMLG